MTAAQAQAVEIGGVTELSGNAEVLRSSGGDYPLEAEKGLAIQQNDEAITRNGRMAITFLDDSVVKLTEHSELYIDEYIYDPDPSKAKMGLTFAIGTSRFISGALAKIDKQNISLKTPTANILIRGTDFSVTVDEIGRSLIILLPDPLGLSSGEIVVSTLSGESVVLNKPFEATTVDVIENGPSSPVILDLSLDMIDNMMIISEPEEEEQVQDEEVIQQQDNILDFADLDIDYLDEDLLGEDELEFTELDINYLDVNFLEDLLDDIDELEVGEQPDALATDGLSYNIQGTKIGQDLQTQIITLVTGGKVSLERNVGQYARVDVDPSEVYTVIFIQNGVSNVVKINGGTDSVIRITQADG